MEGRVVRFDEITGMGDFCTFGLHPKALVLNGCEFNDLGVLVRIEIVEEIINRIYVLVVNKYFVVKVRGCGVARGADIANQFSPY